MDRLPAFESYGDYSSSNYGVNALVFSVDGVDYYFSYKTLVAFRSIKTGLVCQMNYWSKTTGKHLNWIQPDHSKRVAEEEFKRLLATV